MIKDIGFDYDGTLTDELNFTVSEFLEFHRKEKIWDRLPPIIRSHFLHKQILFPRDRDRDVLKQM